MKKKSKHKSTLEDGYPTVYCSKCGKKMNIIHISLTSGYVWICENKQCEFYGLVKTLSNDEFYELVGIKK